MPCMTRPCCIHHSSSATQPASSQCSCTRRCSKTVAISHSKDVSAQTDASDQVHDALSAQHTPHTRSTAEAGAVLLEARALYFSYATTLPEVVCDASLRLQRGTLGALIGANGSDRKSVV